MTGHLKQWSGTSCSLPALFALIFTLNQACALVQIDFIDGNGLDGKGTDGSITVTDPANLNDITLSTVDVVGSDGSRASTGTGNVMYTLGGTSGSADALGVDTLGVGGSNEARDLDAGEAWVFSFDVDIELNAMDFAGWTAGEPEITLSFSNALPDRVLTDSTTNATFNFTNLIVAAGTEITMALTNTTGDQAVRLKYISVTAVPPLPEGIIYNNGDGFSWTTTETDFIEDGVPTVFMTGDDVIFPDTGNLAVSIEEGGVTAGDVTWTATRNGTLKFLPGGSLTATNILSVDDGDIEIQNTTTITGTATFLENADFEVRNGGVLTVASLLLGGDSQLWVDTGGVYNSGTTTILSGGADIRADIDMSLGQVINSIDENPIDKKGAGILDLTAGMGTELTGPIRLTISEGSVMISGSQQINIGGASVFNGDLIMNGPRLELHASSISGGGSIRVQASSVMGPLFSEGISTVQIPVVIESGQTLTVDPTFGSATELVLSGNLSGAGNLRMAGSGLCVISGGLSSYDGSTTVENGFLRFTQPVMSNTGVVKLTGAGKLSLTHGQGDVVDSLFIDGVQMDAGTYGSSSVGGIILDSVDDSRFVGAGYLIVSNGPPSADYATWAAGTGVTGLPGEDDDNDGVSNEDEYVFGLNPTSASSSNPISVGLDSITGTFSYTRRNSTAYATGLDYSYEYSLSLGADWTEITEGFLESSDGGDPVETITVTIPVGLLSNDALFVRVIGD